MSGQSRPKFELDSEVEVEAWSRRGGRTNQGWQNKFDVEVGSRILG